MQLYTVKPVHAVTCYDLTFSSSGTGLPEKGLCIWYPVCSALLLEITQYRYVKLWLSHIPFPHRIRSFYLITQHFYYTCYSNHILNIPTSASISSSAGFGGGGVGDLTGGGGDVAGSGVGAFSSVSSMASTLAVPGRELWCELPRSRADLGRWLRHRCSDYCF